MYVSSVSPERWEVITPHPAFFASFTAWIASEIDPMGMASRCEEGCEEGV